MVESGTYAIGVQTLSSTPGMYVTGGLSGEQRELLGTRLLHETCFSISYTYLVSSTVKGDSRTIQGGPMGLLGLLFGGGMSKIAQQVERDAKIIDEMGDTHWLGNCEHDDLPSHLPISEAGFDKALRLLVQEKPSDMIDLVIEQDSLLRVTIHSSNSRNQVKAFLYENADAKDAIAWTTGSRSSQTVLSALRSNERAYRLKIEYETLDQNDPCPSFDLRIMVKAIDNVVNENLRCHGKPLPPAAVRMDNDDFVFSGSYSFPSDYLAKAQGGDDGSLEYDLLLDWPTASPDATYYLDIEAQSDFLATQVSFMLFYEAKDRALKLLGRSHPLPSAAHETHLVERLKLLEREGDLADDVELSGAVLRISLPSEAIELLAQLKERGHLDRGKSEVCHNFQLSVRAELRGNRSDESPALNKYEPPRLMRVRWEGMRVSEGVYDPRTRLIAALEFDRSLSGHYQLLKTTEWAALAQHGPNDTQTLPHPVSPTVKKMAPGDTSTVHVQFAPGSLPKGTCHKLQLKETHGGFMPIMSLPDFDSALIHEDLEVCTSNCLCDWEGTSSCEEATGDCSCREFHTGDDCSQCVEGHTRDPETGECLPVSKCAD